VNLKGFRRLWRAPSARTALVGLFAATLYVARRICQERAAEAATQ